MPNVNWIIRLRGWLKRLIWKRDKARTDKVLKDIGYVIKKGVSRRALRREHHKKKMGEHRDEIKRFKYHERRVLKLNENQT